MNVRHNTLRKGRRGFRRAGTWCGVILFGFAGGAGSMLGGAQEPEPAPPTEIPAPPTPGVVPTERTRDQDRVPEPEPTPDPGFETEPVDATTPPEPTSAPAPTPATIDAPRPSNATSADANANAEQSPMEDEEEGEGEIIRPVMTAEEIRGMKPASGLAPRRAMLDRDVDLFEIIQEPVSELSLVVGRSKIMQLKRRPRRIALGNDSIFTVNFPPAGAQGGQAIQGEQERRLISIVGLRLGVSDLTIWDEDNVPHSFLVRVTLDTADIEDRIARVFPGADVRVRQVANQIILEGQVPDTKTLNEVLTLVEGEVRINTLAAGAGGAAGGAAAGAAASLASSPGGRPQIINRIQVPGPKQIMLKVKLAELNRSAIREIGVNWLRTKNNTLMGSQIGGIANFTADATTTLGQSFTPRAFTTPGVAGGLAIPGSITGGSITGIDSLFNASANAALSSSSQLFGIFRAGEFDLFINALRSNNLATILAEPNLIALDGEPARFIAGGEFPYPVPQIGGFGGGAVVTIQFRPFGAILTFIPHILEDDLIRLDVEPIFSQLNFGAGTSVGGTTVPGVNQRSARTVVELREGQTLALAGLLQKTTNASTQRVPLLGDLPVFGTAFSRNRIETVETELVVCVTPYFVSAVEEDEMPKLPGENVKEPNDIEFYFLGRLEGKTGNEHRSTIQHHTPFQINQHMQSEKYWVIGPHGHAD